MSWVRSVAAAVAAMMSICVLPPVDAEAQSRRAARPQPIASFPLSGSSDVPADTQILVQYDQPLALKRASVKFTKRVGRRTSRVGFFMALDPSATQIHAFPLQPLLPDTRYTVTVERIYGAHGIRGRGFTLSFVTAPVASQPSPSPSPSPSPDPEPSPSPEPSATPSSTPPPPVAGCPSQTLTRAQLSYRGAFRLEPTEWVSGGGPRLGYGGLAFGYDPKRKVIGMAGHSWWHYAAEFAVAPPKIGPLSTLNTARQLTGFFNITGSLNSDKQLSGIAYWEQDGLTVLGALRQIYYNVSGERYPSLSVSTPPIRSGMQVKGSFWVNSSIPEHRTSSFLNSIPDSIGDACFGGRSLLAGGGGNIAGLASADLGAGLYALQKVSFTSAPPAQTNLNAITLISHPYPDKGEPGFKACDSWRGATYVTNGNRAAVLMVGRTSENEFYGLPEDAERAGVQVCSGGKGYHCGPFHPKLRFYNPDTLRRAAAGEIASWQVQPEDEWDIRSLLAPDCDYELNGIGFDESTGEILISQRWGDSEDGMEPQPLIHVFKVVP